MSVSLNQLLVMVQLQDRMNAKINPDYLQAGYPYLRAVVVEGGEGMEHHGWKWWKSQVANLPQLQMELVDIWHFYLSDFLIKAKGDQAYAASAIHNMIKPHSAITGRVAFDGVEYSLIDTDLVRKLELIIGLAVSRRLSMGLFESTMKDSGLDWDALFRQYVGKNILNIFRQDHGYKAGTYLKEWIGREDNEHLVEIMEELDANAAGYSDLLYKALKGRYAAAVEAAAAVA